MAERFIPKAQEIYRHFMGNLYQVMAVAEHTETGEQLVIYQAMYGDFKIYARPLELFVAPVDREKYPDASQDFYFRLQGPGAERQRSENKDIYRISTGEEKTKTQTVIEKSSMEERVIMTRHGVEKQLSAAEAEEKGRLSAAEVGEKGRLSAAEAGGKEQFSAAETEAEEPGLDPLVLEFLDARTYEQRLNVLAALHHRITNEMITTMSLCCDIEVEGDDVEQRYEDLKQCLITKERFEIKRLV